MFVTWLQAEIWWLENLGSHGDIGLNLKLLRMVVCRTS